MTSMPQMYFAKILPRYASFCTENARVYLPYDSSLLAWKCTVLAMESSEQ
jgi:hypothetical protein